ncbi:MAG TPA: DUF2892 domain-containing protein [Thermoanaerobaculia bacterium]|nr:DUF2892 domain-containing protein [Thermoanaerobaculia bacterium]
MLPIRNQARWDRGLRIALGATLLLVGFFGGLSGLAAVALRIFGWLPLLTGLAGWSPVYAFFGLSTMSRPRKR